MKYLTLDPKDEIYRFTQLTARSIVEWLLRGEIEGLQHIPQSGGFIIACNHVSFLDPPAIGALVRRPISYFARDTLFKPGFMDWLLRSLNSIPVKRDSGSDISAMKRTLNLLKKEKEGLLFFPEGTRSLDGKLQKAQPGIGLIACKTAVPIIPVRIYGMDRALGKTQKRLDLSRPVSIRFGAPIFPESYDPGPKAENRYQESANNIMAAIANLAPVLPPCV